jgi:hypothetical protein
MLEAREDISRASTLQFTCFTSTKVQIVTHLGGHLLLLLLLLLLLRVGRRASK